MKYSFNYPYIDKDTGQESITHYTDMVISRMNWGLNFEQQLRVQDKVMDEDCKMTALEIAAYAINVKKLDKDSAEFKNIRAYIAKVKRILDGGKQEYDFTQEQLAKIQTMSGKGISALDITRDLFPNLTGDLKVKGEMKSVVNYCKAIGQFHSTTETTNSDDSFVPPEAQSRLIRLINESNTLANYPLSTPLNSEQRKNLDSLRSYLKSPRFVSIANTIPPNNNREVFIREFVKAVYDKPGLNSEDINGFVSLCNLYHEELNIKARIELFSEDLKNQVHNAGGDSYTLKANTVKMISEAGKELAEIRKQQQSLQKDLSDTRAKRIANQKEKGVSMSDFVIRWKDEENRKQDLKIAKAHQIKLLKEVDRLQDFDGLIAEIQGVHPDELLNL